MITGDHNQSAIDTLVERQTRMVRLLHLPFRDGDSLHAALTARMRDLPAVLLPDHLGSGFRNGPSYYDRAIAGRTSLLLRFTFPVVARLERARQRAVGLDPDFPKGTGPTIHSPEHLLAIKNELHSRPRIFLQDRCPTELFTALLESQNPSVLRR